MLRAALVLVLLLTAIVIGQPVLSDAHNLAIAGGFHPYALIGEAVDLRTSVYRSIMLETRTGTTPLVATCT